MFIFNDTIVAIFPLSLMSTSGVTSEPDGRAARVKVTRAALHVAWLERLHITVFADAMVRERHCCK